MRQQEPLGVASLEMSKEIEFYWNGPATDSIE
jgi:hypothetical protein